MQYELPALLLFFYCRLDSEFIVRNEPVGVAAVVIESIVEMIVELVEASVVVVSLVGASLNMTSLVASFSVVVGAVVVVVVVVDAVPGCNVFPP